MPQWWIGCSGFHYKEWKEIFYPKGVPQTKWFEYYCQHFNTIELNTTFYRFPRPEALQSWYKRSPADFRFSVKAPRLITHYKHFTDSERLLGDFYASVYEGLEDKLGPVLFQLPSRLKFTEEILHRIIDSVNPSFDNVVEFRDISWWNEKVYSSLKKNKISFTGNSHPTLPDWLLRTIQYYITGFTEYLYCINQYTPKYLSNKFRSRSGYQEGLKKHMFISTIPGGQEELPMQSRCRRKSTDHGLRSTDERSD